MCSFFCLKIDHILNLPVPLYKGLLPCLPKLLTCGASDYIQSQLCGNSASLARNSFLPGPSDMPRAAFQIRVALFQPPRVLCWWGFPETLQSSFPQIMCCLRVTAICAQLACGGAFPCSEPHSKLAAYRVNLITGSNQYF